MQREGLNPQHLHILQSASGTGTGWITPGGENAIVVYPGANLALNAAHVRAARAEIARATLLYGQFETAPAVLDEAFLLAAQAGSTTVLNPSPWQMPSATLRANTHVLMGNAAE